MRLDSLQLFDAVADVSQHFVACEICGLRIADGAQRLNTLFRRTIDDGVNLTSELAEERRSFDVAGRRAPLIGNILGQEAEHLVGVGPVDERHRRKS